MFNTIPPFFDRRPLPFLFRSTIHGMEWNGTTPKKVPILRLRAAVKKGASSLLQKSDTPKILLVCSPCARILNGSISVWTLDTKGNLFFGGTPNLFYRSTNTVVFILFLLIGRVHGRQGTTRPAAPTLLLHPSRHPRNCFRSGHQYIRPLVSSTRAPAGAAGRRPENVGGDESTTAGGLTCKAALQT